MFVEQQRNARPDGCRLLINFSRELSLAVPDRTLLPQNAEVCPMRLSELRRQMAKVRTVVRNPQEVEKLHEIMEQVQRLEKDWETIEAIRKGSQRAG